ncbi:MAG: hypothetical protein RDU13_03500 [Elusimicrobiales bacterium]|jgi:hypothetical protein|nr:hypothetical protein [Elusimicrobiales bacterium]
MGSVEIISLGDDFARWAGIAAESAPEERALSFMREVVSPNREYYEALVFDDIPAGERRLKAASAIAEKYYEKRDAMGEAFGYAGAALRGLSEEFFSMFPGCRNGMTLVAMPSLRRFNGREKLIGGKAVAGFGVEYFIAERYRDAAARDRELRLTAAHEMFHLYHGEKSGIWQSPGKTVLIWLWAEGLAVIASRVFCPGATDAEILMDDELAGAGDGAFKEFFEILSPALFSTSAADLADIFNGGRSYRGLPSRVGYLIGLLAVESIAERGVSLSEMSSWSEVRASEELKSSLFSL